MAKSTPLSRGIFSKISGKYKTNFSEPLNEWFLEKRLFFLSLARLLEIIE